MILVAHPNDTLLQAPNRRIAYFTGTNDATKPTDSRTLGYPALVGLSTSQTANRWRPVAQSIVKNSINIVRSVQFCMCSLMACLSICMVTRLYWI